MGRDVLDPGRPPDHVQRRPHLVDASGRAKHPDRRAWKVTSQTKTVSFLSPNVRNLFCLVFFQLSRQMDLIEGPDLGHSKIFYDGKLEKKRLKKKKALRPVGFEPSTS